MPSDSRLISLPGRAALAALAAASAACPPGFVDPNPPVLQRVERLWSPPVEDEPTVFSILLDLHLARGLDCAGTKARIAAQAGAILLPPGASGMELPLQDISPLCRQASDRHFDPGALDAAIQRAEAAHGSRRVRALLLYVNDVDLVVPESLQSDFAGLRILSSQRSAPLPLAWAVTLGRGKDGALFERLAGWTHSTDPGLLAELTSIAGRELPLRGLADAPAGGVPLFSAEEAASIVELKACGPADPRVTPVGFAFDGRARKIDRFNPPRFLFSAPASPPVMRSGFSVQPVNFWLETCAGNCDRFTRRQDGSIAAWNKTPGCVLGAGQ